MAHIGRPATPKEELKKDGLHINIEKMRKGNPVSARISYFFLCTSGMTYDYYQVRTFSTGDMRKMWSIDCSIVRFVQHRVHACKVFLGTVVLIVRNKSKRFFLPILLMGYFTSPFDHKESCWNSFSNLSICQLDDFLPGWKTDWDILLSMSSN